MAHHPTRPQMEKTTQAHQPVTPPTQETKEGNPILTEEKLPPKSPEVTEKEAAQVQEVAKTGKPIKEEASKWVTARIMNEDGDIVMGHIRVPESDRRPAVPYGSRIIQDDRVMPGNPGKNSKGPVELA